MKGWDAIKTKIKLHCEAARQPQVLTDSYIVLSCPQFDRDALDYGMKWSNKENQIVRRKKKTA